MYIYIVRLKYFILCEKNQFPLNDSICHNSNLFKHMTNKELEGCNDSLIYQTLGKLCLIIEEKNRRICL